ncbi:hypothetical protein ABGB17_07160 [Sphaerisporangium sp. B11E5]|uniref:hypothetical protein n=1 Tax=Sphaerisporangium sp. B11E5 TaxID=3153563 RepID=UPI00325D8D91
MRRRIVWFFGVVTLAAAVLVPATGAAADSCGASSYLGAGGYQYVGYHNCGSGSVSLYGNIMGNVGGCQTVAAGSSVTLHSAYVGPYQAPWSVHSC